MAKPSNKTFLSKWSVGRDSKYRGEAEAFFGRLRALAPDAELSVDRHGIIGFGRGADDFPLMCMTIRADGLRWYASGRELAKHKKALGRRLTGKGCVTLKTAGDLDDAILKQIVTASLAANRICSP